MDITNLTFHERDEFKRKSIAEKIISLLQSDIDISPMVIDGSWGTGKTEFCHKLINLMAENNTHLLIYIDAFKADHANEPLITVLAEVIKTLPEGEDKRNFINKALPAIRYSLKTVAKAGLSHVLRQDASDVVSDFKEEIQKTADKAIDATVESILKDHIEADKNLAALQSTLAEIAVQKPIVLFVDELDRCRPNFAVDILEIIKHTFDVNGVNFVLITNTQQLKASINHCYGSAVDAQRYLDKFVKFTLMLPETINTGTNDEKKAPVEHYKKLVQSSSVLKKINLHYCSSIEIIKTLIAVNQLSLREIETIVRHIEIYVSLKEKNNLESDTLKGIKILTVFIIVIYCIKPELAFSIIQKRLNAQEIGDILGIPFLTKNESNIPDEKDIICYVLGKNAKFNSDKFTPHEENIRLWNKGKDHYFHYGYFKNDDDYIKVCAEVIHTLTMC